MNVRLAAAITALLLFTATAHSADFFSYRNVGPTDIGVFAEIERLCYGTTTMPLGRYNCRLLLSEESFHQSGDGNGYWASAMSLTFRNRSLGRVSNSCDDRISPVSVWRGRPGHPRPARPSDGGWPTIATP